MLMYLKYRFHMILNRFRDNKAVALYSVIVVVVIVKTHTHTHTVNVAIDGLSMG